MNSGPRVLINATNLTDIAEWLCAIGYGVDFTDSEHPLPEVLREPLAVAWHKRDSYPDGPTLSDYVRMLEDEGCW